MSSLRSPQTNETNRFLFENETCADITTLTKEHTANASGDQSPAKKLRDCSTTKYHAGHNVCFVLGMLYAPYSRYGYVLRATSAWIEVRNHAARPFFLRSLPVMVKSASDLMVQALSFDKHSVFWIRRSVVQEGFVSASSRLRHARWGRTCKYHTSVGCFFCVVSRFKRTW